MKSESAFSFAMASQPLWKVSAVLQKKFKIQETPSTETFYGFVNVENVNMGSAESIDDRDLDADQ